MTDDYLQEREELEIAQERLDDPATEWVDHEQVREELGLDPVVDAES